VTLLAHPVGYSICHW